MSNKRGIRSYYLIMNKLEEQLLLSPFVKTVTFGDITQVDLRKANYISFVSYYSQQRSSEWTSNDIQYDYTSNGHYRYKQAVVVDQFTGNTDEMDILNTQLGVGNRLVEQMRSGQLFNDMYQVSTDVTFEPFFDRFGNELVGWAMNLNITVENDIYIC